MDKGAWIMISLKPNVIYCIVRHFEWKIRSLAPGKLHMSSTLDSWITNSCCMPGECCTNQKSHLETSFTCPNFLKTSHSKYLSNKGKESGIHSFIIGYLLSTYLMLDSSPRTSSCEISFWWDKGKEWTSEEIN